MHFFESIQMRVLHHLHSMEGNLCLRLPLFRFLFLLLCSLRRVRRRERGFLEGKSKKANTGTDARDEHGRAQVGSPCGYQSKVAEHPVPHACSSSPSALTSDPPDFALLYYTLVMDDAIPVGYLREFMSLETPARRAARRALISAASITDSTASTALSAFRQEAGRRATEFGTIGDQLAIALQISGKKGFVRSGSVRSTTGPLHERTRKQRNEIVGFNSSRTCSGQRTRQWGS